MYLPIFIALLLGLINPSHTNNCNGGGTVYVTTNDSNPSNSGEEEGEGDGEDDGNDGPGAGGPGGNTGNPPPKP